MIHACVKDNGQVRIVNAASECKNQETHIQWNIIGLLGPKGDTGATGAQGPKGDTGASGATGPQGAKGDTGATGAVGETGSAGPAGPKGDTGTTGALGPIGETGPQGEIGPQGLLGLQGLQGPKGDTGATGPAPITVTLAIGDPNCPAGGTQFNSGDSVTYACNGAQGAQGIKGDTGDTGPQGPSGISGFVVVTYDTGIHWINGGSTYTFVVTCPSNKYALSGGYKWLEPSLVTGTIMESSWQGSPSSWDFTVRNPHTGLDYVDYRFFVVCVTDQ